MMDKLRKLRASELAKVAEVIDRQNFLNKTFNKTWSAARLDQVGSRLTDGSINPEKLKTIMEGNLLTYLLHW